MQGKQFILNILASLFVSLFLILFVSCSPNTSRTQADDTKQPNETNIEQEQPYFFWKAEKQGKISYWLGTMHVGVSLLSLSCSHTITNKLNNSDLCFTEILSSEEKNNQDNELFSPNNEDFKQLDFNSQLFLTTKGLPENLNYLHYVATLEMMCIREILGPSALHIHMDKEVEEIAQSKGIPVKALDTIDTLIPANNSATKEDVVKKIENYPHCLVNIENSLNRYKNGKWLFNKEMGTEYYEHALKNRNEKWMAKFLSAYNDYNNIFVAVGLAHFIGPFNLIDMLKEAGFSMKQMSCSNAYWL